MRTFLYLSLHFRYIFCLYLYLSLDLTNEEKKKQQQPKMGGAGESMLSCIFFLCFGVLQLSMYLKDYKFLYSFLYYANPDCSLLTSFSSSCSFKFCFGNVYLVLEIFEIFTINYPCQCVLGS